MSRSTRRSTRLVREPAYLRDLFGRNSATYDPVNELISLGQVGRWRRRLVDQARPLPGERVLDAFSGPGGLALLTAPRLGGTGELVLVDVSPAMLERARGRFRALAERLPGESARLPSTTFLAGDLFSPARKLGHFDLVLLGFALRYTDRIDELLDLLGGHLRPGGRLAVIDFVPQVRGGGMVDPGPARLVERVWSIAVRLVFHRFLPPIAGRLGHGREVYDYLSASTARGSSETELRRRLAAAGLSPVWSERRMGGLVVLLVAQKAQDMKRQPSSG